jgi:hypothetical protein
MSIAWDRRNTYRILVGESLGKLRRISIKMNLVEVGCEDGRWMELAQDCVQWRALLLAVLNLQVLLPEC